MTDSLKLAAQKALAQRLQQFRHAHWTHWSTEENQLIVDCFHALQHQEEREPPLFYAFKHNWGNGKIGWTFHTPEEQATAYRDTCLEIIPLHATPPLLQKEEGPTVAEIDAALTRHHLAICSNSRADMYRALAGFLADRAVRQGENHG